MSKVATNTNLKLPLPLKPAPSGWWRQVKNFKGQWQHQISVSGNFWTSGPLLLVHNFWPCKLFFGRSKRATIINLRQQRLFLICILQH